MNTTEQLYRNLGFDFFRLLGAASVAPTESKLHLTRGDLGQLAPRKKLLKSWQSFQKFSETLRALWHGGFFVLSPSALPQIEFHVNALIL